MEEGEGDGLGFTEPLECTAREKNLLLGMGPEHLQLQ